MTLRTVDLNFSFSPGDPDFLSAAGTGINMMCFSLFHHIFFFSEPLSDFCCHGKILLIFRITFLNVSGKHTKICINDGSQTHGIQNRSRGASITEKNRSHNAYQGNSHGKPCKSVHTINFINFSFMSMHLLSLLIVHCTPEKYKTSDNRIRQTPIKSDDPVPEFCTLPASVSYGRCAQPVRLFL